MRAVRRSKISSLLSVLACAVVLFSCGGDSTGPGGGGASVSITPATDSLQLGASVALHATVTDADGKPVSGASVFWSSESSATATVSSTGVVTGIDTGTVRIAASSNGKSGFATITVIPTGVASVRVTPSSAAIKVGETVHFQADALDASGNVLTGRTITWSSGNNGIATVDNTGLASGVATGATTITATSEGKTGSAGIAVAAAVPAAITVAPASVTITTGQTSQLTATVKDANGAVISGAPVQWTVDHSNIALVSSTGLVTGEAQGTATVTATSGSVHVNVTVTVTLPPANAVIVSPSTVALLVSERQQLTATVTDAGGNTLPGQTITWSSSNTAVAVVGSTGLVIAVAPGTATITGMSGAVSGVSHVTVSLVPVRRVTVDPDALAFTQGDAAQQLTVTLLDSAGGTLSQTGRPVTFSSSKTSVATVSSSGLVTPVGPGSAVITVTQTGSGLTATVTVTVAPVPVASVTIAPALDTLIVGQAIQLAASTKDGSGNTLTGRTIVWDGSDDAVASVSSNGRVTALAPGSMTVTATSEGKTGTATIVVLAVPVATVTVTPANRTVVVGANTAAFVATSRDASNNILNGRTATWSSSDPTIATIDPSTGIATGVAPGVVTITATVEGKTGTATLTVTAIPVATVTISPTSASVQVGSTTPAFTAVTKDAGGNTLTGRAIVFASSNPSVATINATTGVATGVGPGTATITATSEGKTSNNATLTVTAVPVASVTISPTTQSVQVGSTTPAFTVVTKDAGGNVLTGRTITFNSSNTGVATIDPTSGVATGQSPGTTTITATSEGKTSNNATLTVSAIPVASVTISPTTQTVVDGSNTPAFTAVTKDAGGNVLTGRTVVFASSNTAVATIDPTSGVATGQSPGTTTITASSEGKTSNNATLTVTPVPVASVTVSPSSQTITAGGNSTFTAVTKDGSGNTLTGRTIVWSSSDPTIASIDPNTGVATGVAAGSVTITATSEGQSGTASLTVNPVPVASVDISPTLGGAAVGGTQQYTATPRDAGGNALTGRVVTFTTGDATVATIDSNGLLTGVGPGFTTVTAHSEGIDSNSVIATIVP